MTDVKIRCDDCKFVEDCVDYGWQECKKFTPKQSEPMTKLCDTCEYLRYCARSGIEDVGCDRYKKDTTTNEEWLRSATTDELAYILRDTYLLGYTHGHNGADIHGGWSEWLKEKHE